MGGVHWRCYERAAQMLNTSEQGLLKHESEPKESKRLEVHLSDLIPFWINAVKLNTLLSDNEI